MKQCRERILLKAAYDILKQCHETPYVVNPMLVIATHDGVVWDGFSLANDIADLIELEELQ